MDEEEEEETATAPPPAAAPRASSVETLFVESEVDEVDVEDSEVLKRGSNNVLIIDKLHNS